MLRLIHTRRRLAALATVAGLATVAVSGCGGGGSGSSSGQLTVLMTDAPIDGVKEVNVTITRVEVHRGASDAGGAWETVFEGSRTFNLLSLANVPDVTQLPHLVDDGLPAGHYTQLRLIVSSANLVMEDGTTHPVVIPSGADTGLKALPFDIASKQDTVLVLDFDVAQSVNLQGDGTYKLTPVIRLAPVTLTATLTGKVVDAAGAPMDDAQVTLKDAGGAIVATSLTSVSDPSDPAKDGVFALHGLASGSYTLEVSATGYTTESKTVTVSAPTTTDAGSVSLNAAAGP
jgi:hypothetical protein